MATVAGLAHDLARQTDPELARPALCDAALQLTGAAGVALFEVSESTGDLRVSCSAGDGVSNGFKGCASHAHATAEPVVSGASLWHPIVREHSAVAVLAFRWPDVEARENAAEEIISLLATETSVTLERLDLMQRLEASARTDELTGLPNRRAWQEELPRELARAERESSSLCVAMLDIDHFKAFNDRHGHLAGDLLLKEAAAAWTAKLRVTDMLARFGGEEFTLAIPACGEQEALALVERLRAAMPKGVTCSAGVAVWNGTEPAAALLERADRALYLAKEHGRDRGELATT
jgi:diguanylate cyclase (GGDEF)-like protein